MLGASREMLVEDRPTLPIPDANPRAILAGEQPPIPSRSFLHWEDEGHMRCCWIPSSSSPSTPAARWECPMPGLRKQLGCFPPSFEGGFPCLWHLSLPHSVPRDAFGGGRTACASHRVAEAAPLYRHLCSQQGFLKTASNLRAGMQHSPSPELLLLLDPLPSLQPLPCTPHLHQGLCPAVQPKISQRTGPEPVHFPDIVPK